MKLSLANLQSSDMGKYVFTFCEKENPKLCVNVAP